MKNGKKQSQKSARNMKKDFKQFFIEQTGQSLIKEGQFQQVQSLESEKDESSSDNQFQVQDEEEQTQVGIKAAQFWNGIKMPNNASPPSKSEVNWDVRCPMSFGFNSLGRDNIFYLDGQICKAVGCLLIYRQKIYPKHSQKITTLSYNEKTLELLSGTESSYPELFMWKYDKQSQSLQWIKRFFVGKKCQDIYAVSFFLNDYIVAVQKFTLHKASNLHIFNKNTAKKLSSLKVGKFYDLQLLGVQNHAQQVDEISNQDQSQNQRLFFANNQGISEIILKQKQQNSDFIKVQIIHQSTTITCLCPFNVIGRQQNIQILYGNKDGNVSTLFEKNSLRVHQGWIFQIKNQKVNQKDYFFSLGAMDFHLCVLLYQEGHFTVLHKVHLGGYGRSIESQGDMLLIGKRDGSYSEFSIKELTQEKQLKKISKKESLSLKCFDSKDKQRHFFKEVQSKNKNPNQRNYVHGNSGSKNLEFFSFQSNQKNLNGVTNYQLRAYPQTFDLSNNLLAYTYNVLGKEEQDKYFESFVSGFLQKLKKKDKLFQKSVLVIEEYENKGLKTKISIKIQNSQKEYEQKCTVIKLSPSGEQIALGNDEGYIYLLEVGSNDNSSTFIRCQEKMHIQAVRQIIWSQDRKYLKTISFSELFYWQIMVSKQEGQEKRRIRNVKALQVRDVKWTLMGKFGWQVKNVWDRTSFIDEIERFYLFDHTKIEVKESKSGKQVESSKKQMILGVTPTGSLRVYGFPANGQKYKEIKMSNEGFQVCRYVESENMFVFFVLIEGMLVLVELRKQG